MIARRLKTLFIVAVVLITLRPVAAAGPICCPVVLKTFGEDFAEVDIVAIAELVGHPPAAGSERPKMRFRIIEVLKGRELLENSLAMEMGVLETLYLGKWEPDRAFLITGVHAPKDGSPESDAIVAWSSPFALNERVRSYVQKVASLPADISSRLKFYHAFLGDKDEMLAQDACDEFRKASYGELKAFRPHMNRDKLIACVQNKKTQPRHRRVYFTMLGICGSEADLPMLETILRSKDRKRKAGLDAIIGCYLTLKGAEGMPTVEDLYLTNAKADFADTYAAMMAIRFHGSETDVIPRERLLAGLRCILNRPDIADLVIPDLARWQDWSVVDRLVELFKNADDDGKWVRVPTINYLRVCPLPEAKKQMVELKKIDPESFERASRFFAIGD